MDSNRDYCTKEGNYFEKGLPPQQGARNDMVAIKERILNGDDLWDVVTENVVNMQQLRFARELSVMRRQQQRRDGPPELHWYWGPTGSGKTREAYDSNPGCFITSGQSKFWNGYTGQAVVILDDLRGDTFTYTELLRLTDRYPFIMNVKNAWEPLMAKKIIITAPFAPEDFPAPLGENNSQLLRRITTTRHFE